jgi:hypothetical protein
MAEEIVAGATETPEQKETVETPAELKPVGSEQTDYEKIVAEQNAKIEKLTQERDNYRQGVKKWQKKAQETTTFEPNLPENEELDALIDQKVSEKFATSQLSQAVKERDETLAKMARENAELKIALKNRPNSPTSSGTNNDKPEVNTSFFTKEQLEELKARGLDPKKVEENYRKIKEN